MVQELERVTALARALAQVRLATPTRPPLWAPSPPVDSAAEVVHAPSIGGRYKLSRQFLAILLWHLGRNNLAPRRDRNCRIRCDGSAAFHKCTCSDTRPHLGIAGSVSSTGAAFGDAGSGKGQRFSHHAAVRSGRDANPTTVIAALRWYVLGIGCVCGSSTTR